MTKPTPLSVAYYSLSEVVDCSLAEDTRTSFWEAFSEEVDASYGDNSYSIVDQETVVKAVEATLGSLEPLGGRCAREVRDLLEALSTHYEGCYFDLES